MWKSLRKRKGQMLRYTLRHGGSLSDTLDGEVRKKRERLEYFDKIIGYMGCETFREVKELTGMRQSRVEPVVVSNQS